MEVQNFIDIRLYVLLITLICYSIINNYLINGSSEVKYFIGCNKWKTTEHHRYMRIPLGGNISYLQELFQNYNVNTNISEVNNAEVYICIYTCY